MEDEDHSGSITESEYVSATDLESEDDEFSGPCAYSHNEDDEEPKKHRNGVSSESDNEVLAANVLIRVDTSTGRKRGTQHLHGATNVRKRSKKGHNTSHAAKEQCVDIQEIKECLNTKDCHCDKQCLQKLKHHKSRAIRAIEKLRLQRFSGKLVLPLQLLTYRFPHPGVKNNSYPSSYYNSATHSTEKWRLRQKC